MQKRFLGDADEFFFNAEEFASTKLEIQRYSLHTVAMQQNRLSRKSGLHNQRAPTGARPLEKHHEKH